MATEVHRVKWEYLSLLAGYDGAWKIQYPNDSPDMDEELGRLGANGWELVDVVPVHETLSARLKPASEGCTYGPGHNTFAFSGGSLASQWLLFFERPMQPAKE